MAILSAAEIDGFAIFGEQERVVHGRRIVEPAAGGNALRSVLRMGVVEARRVVVDILSDIGINTKTVKAFLERREFVRLPDELGGGIEARPIIPGISADNLSRFDGSDGGYDLDVEYGADPVIDAAARKYKLNSLFRDVTQTDKLQISARRMQSARRLAITDPAAAAAGLTEYIRAHGFPNASVTAGDYAKTVNNAIDFIRSIGNTITYSDLGAPARVSDTTLEISYDQFTLKEVIWTVIGPLKYATEVNIVYQLAILYGPEHVLFLLSDETIRLNIDIRNELTGDYYTGTVVGYSSLAGIKPEHHGFPSELTADQHAQLSMAAKKISPVYVDDAVIGTAVHVSDKHVILNEHTLTIAAQADCVPVLCGKPIDESSSVSGDICVVKRDTEHARWHFREPNVGERVVLCYSVGKTVEYSEVLQVMGFADQLVLSDSNVLRKGASGAAVVALRDFALLGIFSSKNVKKVFCAPFTSSSFAIVSDCQSVASVSQYGATPGTDVGDHTYAKMVKRGFMGFLEGIERSIAPLYIDSQGVKTMAGVVANVAGEWLTTVNPNFAQLSMRDNRLLSFNSVAEDLFVAHNPPPVLQALPNIRAVEPGERVFIFTKADNEVVMSSVRVVMHKFSDDKGFVVEDFGHSADEMTGGLIVAERDAAVVGMYSIRDCDVFGKFTVHCVSLFRTSISVVASVEPRTARLEFLNVVLPYDDQFVEYVDYGKQFWSIMLGKRLVQDGVALTRAVASASDVWQLKHRDIMEALFWPFDAQVAYDYPMDTLALAYLAFLYLKDSNFVIARMKFVLTNVMSEIGYIVGDYPFPRSASATGSVGSRVDSGSESRIQELEQRMLKLTEMVVDRDKRLSSSMLDLDDDTTLGD